MVAFRIRKKSNSCITVQRIIKRPLIISSDNVSVNGVRPSMENRNKNSPLYTSININSDRDKPRDIDLHVNTRLLIKSNKKFDYVKTALITVLIFETILFYIVYNKVTSNVQTMERLMYQTRSTVEDINITKRKVDKLYKVLFNSYIKTTAMNRQDQIMRHMQKRDLSMIGVNNNNNNNNGGGISSLSQRVKRAESSVNSSRMSDMKHNSGNETSAVAVHLLTGEDLNEDDLVVINGRNTSISEVGQRSARTVRASRRGKQSKRKSRDGCRHSRCSYRHKSGIIAPWYVDSTDSGEYALTNVSYRGGKIEITENGLYFIYAQVYYLTNNSLNSYSINVQTEDRHLMIAMCSAEAATGKQSEVSCYTAIVRYLHAGEKLYLTQRERNRMIIFRDGKTFLGIAMLN